MIEVHFYKETELKYSVYANNIEDVIEGPASYYTEYTTNMLISAVKYINPVLDNGNLREATKEELVAKGIEVQLEPGEIIQDKKLVKIPQPSKYHTWNGNEWLINLDDVKKLKLQELKSLRDEKISEDIEVDEAVFQIKEKDLQKFLLKKVEADIHPELKEVKEDWRLADNTYKKIDFSDVLKILEAYGTRQRKVFKEFGMLEHQINNCSTVEEIEAIKWE
ncbi:DUF4376 domain-containing protein [Fusobacterium gastrosuis]|uniref:DUF4376 domain-containing protein n=1 Tax=Fusobacterium gastrosuis TaxID=1755100 RepID=UPI00297B11E4|nr:DUF4376 domain-containing protein [Fusobacteriaceae bacterium]MDY5713622.1 DUF4376 domain-containing protein [Fusobacterium gastrosuis]